MPEKLWTEVHDLVQEAVIKTIPKKKKCKKEKWLSEEALQIAEKRREAKGEGEKERYIHLNAEFQRLAQKDKKAFLSEVPTCGPFPLLNPSLHEGTPGHTGRAPCAPRPSRTREGTAAGEGT